MLISHFNKYSYLNRPTHTRRKICLNYFKTITKLAKDLTANTCANLFDFIKNIIYIQTFQTIASDILYTFAPLTEPVQRSKKFRVIIKKRRENIV
jgi:hypothetical protein